MSLGRIRWIIVAVLTALCVGCSDNSPGEDSHRDNQPAGSSVDHANAEIVSFSVFPVEDVPAVPPESPWRHVTLEIESAPSSITAGDKLEFVVAITNDAGDKIDPGELCPAYFMNFGEGAVSAVPIVSLLNCDDASSIAPGSTERFAMEIEMPPDLELNTGSIYWRLDPSIAAISSSEIPIEHPTS
jgi:hypothetical protein